MSRYATPPDKTSGPKKKQSTQNNLIDGVGPNSESSAEPDADAEVEDSDTDSEQANPQDSIEDWIPNSENSRSQCQNCGNPVSNDFCGAYGDNSSRIEACPDCSTAEELTHGKTVGNYCSPGDRR